MSILLLRMIAVIRATDFMTYLSFSPCEFCRLMLTVEQLVTASYNTSETSEKNDFSFKVGNLLTMEDLTIFVEFFHFLWLFFLSTCLGKTVGKNLDRLFTGEISI